MQLTLKLADPDGRNAARGSWKREVGLKIERWHHGAAALDKTAAVAIRNAEILGNAKRGDTATRLQLTLLQGSYSESLSSLECAWERCQPRTHLQGERVACSSPPSHMAAVVSGCTSRLHLPWRALGAMAPGCSVLLFDTLIYLYMLRELIVVTLTLHP